MREHNARSLAVLKALAATRVPFVTVGSAGVLLRHPVLREHYRLPDVDVLLSPADVAPVVRWALGRGHAVTVWGEPWREGLPLDGKFYVRVDAGGVQLDVTFEEPDLSLATLLQHAQWCDGVPVCDDASLWHMKRRANRVKADALERLLTSCSP